MKLSDISSQKLSPGRYLITASYDGDAVYNSAQAQLILTIDESGGAHIDIQPIDDGGAMQVVKVEPDISFNPSTLNIIEKNLEEYPFDWTSYLSNPKDVPYSLYTSTGLELDGYQRLCWNASGTYVLTLITTETDLYLSKTINLTLNITAKINPQIEYVNNNEQFTLENGNFTKRYRNIEKREGVYMFDLLQPTNPYALPLKYKISDEKHGTIDVDDNKIYISEEGKYKITAYYEGDDTYRSSITYYILKYYEGEEPADDETEPAQHKQNPNLSFELSNVTQNKENDNLYKVLPLINPYSVSGGIWVVSKGSINYDGTTITYDGTGSIMVFYEFPGNDKYNAQTASYILNIKSEDNPDNLPLPDVGFGQMIVTVQENEPHEYQIQYAYNNSGVAINYYYNDELIENGILKTTDLGNLNIVGITENNGTFASTKIYYTLRIEKYEAQDPEISFDQPSTTEYQSSNYEYLLQFVNNPHEVELEWSSSKGVITDNVLYCEELGTIIITVKSKPSFYYLESTISYTLVIEETPKLSPELSFDDEAQFFNGNGTLQYPVQAVNNPHNVELRWFSDRGELNSEMNPTYLTISAYAGPINIYCKSVEDETYKSETVTYKLYVGATRKYLEYTKHEDYTIEKNQGTFDLEMLRYAKSQDLEFDPTEWTFTSSLQSYCTVKEKYYIEEDDYIVVMAKLKITKPCNPLISISFSGNDYFYNISNIRVHVNLVGKELLDPEISFSNSYEVADLTEDGKYLLQDVNNPHNVEIIYSASSGTVQDHILTYEGKFNVIVKATSIENDTYSSKTISYKLGFQEPQKPSSGIHFGQSTITVTQTNDGIYELQGLLDAEDNPIADTSTLGYYSANIFGDITYDENRGCWTIKNTLFNGNATIRFIIYETNTYRKETITYTLTILSNEKADPELSFDKYQINVTENNENRWPVQRLNNPHNVPVTWFCTKGEFDDPNNPQYITYDKREYISIGVQSQETETYASRKQSYGMSILLPSLKNPNLSFEKSSEGFTMNEEGIYPIQKIINPYNVSPITYTASSGEIIDGYLHRQGQGNITITATYPGDKEYESSLNRYTLSIVQNSKKYLHIETCGSVEIEGELNTDYEVNLVKWPITEEYEYNSEDWTIHSSNYRCKPSTIRTETINGYVYLIGTFQFSSDCYSSIGTEFKGNDGFYSSTGNSNSISITFSHPVEVDNRVVPSLSFNKYMYYVTQTTNYMYELQTLIKPDDVEIDYWEIDYGGYDVETAKIIDDAYVYYEGTDYIHLKVHTKASEKYKAASNGYSMYVNVKTKTGTSIIFASDRITKNKAVDGIYNVQSPTTNPTNLALTWTSSTGELINNNTQLKYSSDGEVTITASFAGDDDHEAATASYKLIISNEYAKSEFTAEKYGDQHIVMDDYGEYSFPLIKWNKNEENLEYTPEQWQYSANNEYLPNLDRRWEYIEMYTQDENEWRILYVKLRIYANGYSYYTLRLKGNPFFYDNSWQAELYFEKPAQERINPKISWPNPNPGNVTYREDNKYLIQTPISEYDDVEFNEPYSGKTIVKEGDNYYIQYSSTGPVSVYISNVATTKYYQSTISYEFKIVDPQVKPTYVLYFSSTTFNRNKSKINEYSLNMPTTNGDINQLQWKSDKDDCIIDSTNKKFYWSGTGTIKITAYYPETEDYGYKEASYILVISEEVQKTYLQTSEYKSQDIEVDFGEYYDIPIIKWPISENLEYNQAEWYLSNSYSSKCVVDHLFTVDEGDYRILKAKCTFTTSGSTYLRIRFLGNDYFYGSSGYQGFYLAFHRAPDIEVRDPQISWPEPTPDPLSYSDEHLYLIQTPTSPFPEVEFNAPTANYPIVEDNGNYYLQVEDWGDYRITISSKATGVLYEGTTRYMYSSSTISYTLSISRPIIEKTDARLAFANAEETLEYQWQTTGKKLYKVQPLYNPYGVPVTFRATPVGGLQKLDNTVYMRDENQTFTGYIDYGYYIEYEDLADITITARMQENDYHYSNTNPSYIMHITRNGQQVNMWFSAQSITQYTNINQLYLIQEVMLRPDIPQIRDNVRYTLMSQSGRIVEDGDQLYLLYTGTGTVRIKATFDGDATYAGAEAIYTLTIEQNTKPEAPIDFPEKDIYTPKNQYDAYPVQQPQSTNGVNYDLTGHLTWTYPSGWYRNTDWAAHMISPVNPIEDDTDVLIKCYLEETQFQEKYMQYTLHIQVEHKTYLDPIVHNDYDLEVQDDTELKLELMKWPISQGYEYDSSEWTFTRWMINPLNNNRYDTDITSYITCEAVDGYYVLYYNCNTGDSGSHIGFDIHYGIDIVFNGNSGYQGGEWGLYIDLTEVEAPEPPVDPQEPNIRFKQDIFNYTIWGDEATTAQLPAPTITYNPEYDYPIEYTYTYWTATPNVDNPQSYEDFTKVGQGITTSGTTIENVQEGYYIIECTTIASDYFYSKTITTVLKVIRNYNREDPTIVMLSTYVNVENMEEVYTYQVPNVNNTSNVEYKWYINNVEISVDENGNFNYHSYSNFVLELRTTQTKIYNSISLYCNYLNVTSANYFGFRSYEDNNEIYWHCSKKDNRPYNQYTAREYTRVIYWSKDKINWTGVRSNQEERYITTLNYGEYVYFKCAENGVQNQDGSIEYGYMMTYGGRDWYNNFVTTKRFEVFGNILSLLYGKHFEGKTLYGSDDAIWNPQNRKWVFPDGYESIEMTRNDYAFRSLFSNCTGLVNARNLILPPTCSSYCYQNMFLGCTSLVTTPELPATTLDEGCYSGMFYNCSSLSAAPELPAKNLVYMCYNTMFYGCTILNYIKALFITPPGSSYTDRWVMNVSATGTFIKNIDGKWDNHPENVTGASGIPSGWSIIQYQDSNNS